MDILKKKRGRKPKNFINPDVNTTVITEKKKRGRKKKYEIENFEKILNRNTLNNFDHNIAYSDDEDINKIDLKNNLIDQKSIKKVAFGNLDITISKNINTTLPEQNYKNIIKHNIIEDEYSEEEEEEEISEEDEEETSEVKERFYKETTKYTTDFTDKIKDQSLKRLRVITCLKNEINTCEWPDKIDTCCWWCCHTFECSPCTLPTKYDSLRKRFTFIGTFCSWNCTKAYNLDKNDQKKYERAGLITLLIQQLYGIASAISIKSSPPRQCLKMFGGYMSIDEFRNKSSLVDSYHLNLINFNYIYPEITEVTNVKLKNENKNLRLCRT